jgi:hypothetical protein
MKHDLNYFYGTGQSLVRMSDRVYQPIDVSSLLKKETLAVSLSDTAKRNIKFATLVISGFLVGGLLGELYVQQVLSDFEFGFLTSASSLFRAVSLPESLSTVFSAGTMGTGLGAVIAFLSTIQVPE